MVKMYYTISFQSVTKSGSKWQGSSNVKESGLFLSEMHLLCFYFVGQNGKNIVHNIMPVCHQ